MNLIINIELGINLILLLLFYLHMLQLNSYHIIKYGHWYKINYHKNGRIFITVLIPLILCLCNIKFLKILGIMILLLTIGQNVPKKKAKIPLKFTNRVKRMIITLIILISIGLIIFPPMIILGIFNLLAPLLIVLADLINYPWEKGIQKYYINDAKRILKAMPNLLVIGITGSYGKTSVKNFLAKMLNTKYEVLMTPQNYNTTMGVVKTIREELKATHQIFICEMGATKEGDIKEICDIVKPKIGIITAIGPQHLESFKTIDNIIKTKMELADAVLQNEGKIFLNYDNEYLKEQKGNNILTYGIENKRLDYNAYNLKSSSYGLSFHLEDGEFKTNLIGRHNIINLTGAIAVARYLGIPLSSLVPKVREIKSVDHRLQLIGKGNMNIIDDSYNSNPVSFKSALNTLGEFPGTKIIITPGVIDLGEREEKFNYELGKYICAVCDYVFLVNNRDAHFIKDGIAAENFAQDKVFMVTNVKEAITKITNLNIQGKVTVLIENDLPDNYNL